MLLKLIASAAALLLSSSAAANPVFSYDFLATNPFDAASALAPIWHFDEKTCAPTDAVVNGQPNPGNAADYCNVFKVDHNCTPQPPWKGDNTLGARFPTYWLSQYCEKDQSFRILYDVYFSKDTGHRHDWEWTIIKLTRNSPDNTWTAAGAWMEQDGKHPWYNWSSISTNNLGHPLLYFGKWHHPVFPDQQTRFFANTCPPNSKSDYRSSDYMWPAADHLVPANVIDPKWSYGNADSTPPAFYPNGKYDICNF
ncbi:uncharacterized protein EV422DRAFT_595518 [Fimicolochytrium jonesii]|uniref:uncharacterized protein n=1 Tax=Fimicolochytrium jonesii TaxID=1396493 RepID=UPI0022FF4376|nr:uncharacterized protein EV422DRAFT_595518 [Fimicolochytrium jonesii]KAI8821144.1 hypothetical protein EV422DRAFT_595518 [Fimicolochytrium jonesii]